MDHASSAGGYNAAVDLIERNLRANPAKIAIIDDAGRYSYAETAGRADRCGAGLLGLGFAPGDRVALGLLDGVDFVACFLGAMKAGLIPIPLNTLFPVADYAYILADSGARAAVVSPSLADQFRAAAAQAGWTGRLVIAGDGALPGEVGLHDFAPTTAPLEPHLTTPQAEAFWLYSSGSTGRPKGAVHRHESLMLTADLFARQVFGMRADDVVYSAAKLFFAYGLGNALTFPMAAGATTVLRAERVTPEVVGRAVAEQDVTVFCGVPTLYAGLLASPHAPGRSSSLRVCLSAGEALPQELGEAWEARTGVEIVDGIGSTEMLHIYVSNRPGAVRYGTTGQAVPGYEVRVVDDAGDSVGPGEVGELFVRGPTCASYYWNNPQKTDATFVDGWMRTGDKFTMDADGFLTHCGRADDMLKVSGNWVSRGEVENALLGHPAVLEAAVIGVPDAHGLTRTKAFVVLKPGHAAGASLEAELQAHAKARLAPYKYPRLIQFTDQLPKTATGKIRRHMLREAEAATGSEAST
ncbi:MAG: benzoate-CoA ligase family protein [Phenylobacterium sp.]|uniref:benzoate-CoA ligase family protein n=1 Tax=Phenylobacterium sp. TaxID=1871053 RepID=UPI002736FFDE|nr:benzoate-CoA ligase family protein [Phenylobacterium sp.]MDP3175415.1 benzoate-CoA ligase family protein [Phenylobacterium sp.]